MPQALQVTAIDHTPWGLTAQSCEGFGLPKLANHVRFFYGNRKVRQPIEQGMAITTSSEWPSLCASCTSIELD